MLTELKERLGSELERLARELALDPGDTGDATDLRRRSANGGAVAERREQLRRLGQLVAALPSVDPATILHAQAGFGSTVSLLDQDAGEEITYLLLAGDFIDVDAGEVSLASPIGQALLGRRAGDEVAVATPGGRRRFRVLSLSTLPEMLGMNETARAASA